MKHNLEEKRRTLRQEVYTADGTSYKFSRMINGRVELTKTNHDVESKLSRYRLATLDENDKKNRYIKDQIFKDYTKITKAKNATLFFSIMFFLAMGGFIVSTLLFKDDKLFFISFIAAAALSLIIGAFSFTYHIYWRHQLNKRKLRID